MKIAFIHSDKKIATGAHYINDLISNKLKERGILVSNFYPKIPLLADSPPNLKGLANILFFYSLLERKADVVKYDIIQGTTYTTLPFLTCKNISTVSHFGSTTRGFLDSTPLAKDVGYETRKIWYDLRKRKVIDELNIKTRRPMQDIADIEKYVALRVTGVIAASVNIRQELINMGVLGEKISVVHNAIEDYWFAGNNEFSLSAPRIVFLGRLGRDAFTLKLKGLDRLIYVFKKFPKVRKTTICMTANKKLKDWIKSSFSENDLFVNFKKDLIPGILKNLKGSILFLPSRYEGFSLSLIEGMSQGLIPVAYPVGVAPEIIKNGENGFIVDSLSEAVARIEAILSDAGLRQCLAERAQRSSHNFESGLMVDKLIAFYNKIVSNSNGKF